MAITITDHRTIRNEADTATGWTGTTTPGTSNPAPIESGGWLGANVGAEIFDSYHTAAAVDLSNAVIYCWVFSRLALGLKDGSPPGGLMVLLSDATPDRIAYKVAGADFAAFRHDEGPTGWQCAALDTQSLPPSPLIRAGAAANLDLTNITAIGTCVYSLSAAPGMDPTYFVDIIRYLLVANNNGCAASIIGGTEGGPGVWSEIAAADRSVGNQQAHGLVRRLATGAFGVQGPLRFGNATGTAASWFEDSNVTVVFEARGFRTTLYKIFITDNGTGTTTFRMHSSSIIAPPGVGAEFDAATDTDVTDVVLDACRFSGFTGGVKLQAGHEFSGGVINESGQVVANGATMNGTQVLLSTAATDTGALLWNVATNTDGLLDDMVFSKGTNPHHAITFGTAVVSDLTLRNCDFNGFGSTPDSNDSTLQFLGTSGALTLTLINCTVDGAPASASNFTVDDATGITVTLSFDPVIVQVTTVDDNGDPIENARVLVKASSGTGAFPYLDSVTITRSGTTATVSHTAHGMATNDYILIRGADQEEYNMVAQITYIGANSYSYVTDGTPTTPATGTITSTFVALYGLTDVNGNISTTRIYTTSQPITGWARKSTSQPFYKQGSISGAISTTIGLSATTVMVSDE